MGHQTTLRPPPPAVRDGCVVDAPDADPCESPARACTAAAFLVLRTAPRAYLSEIFSAGFDREKNSLRHRQNMEIATIASRLCCDDLEVSRKEPVIGMRPIQFDPFGEPVAQGSDEDRPSAASRIALHSGVGLFWAMVVVIVAARAAYFNPEFAEKFGTVASLVGHLKTFVGA